MNDENDQSSAGAGAAGEGGIPTSSGGISGQPVAGPGADSVTGRDLLKGVAIIWGIEIVLGLMMAGLLVLAGDRYLAHGVLFVTVIGTACTFLVSWLFVCRKYGKTLKQGFAIIVPGTRVLVMSAAVGVVAAIGATVLMVPFSTGKSLLGEIASTPFGLAVVVLLSLGVPFFEEVYYRGFIFPVLKKKLGGGLAVLLVTLWFTIAHVGQLIEDPIGIVVILVVGAIWTTQRLLHDSLVPSIVTHLVYNTVLVGFTLAW